jgi:hypothetical protein
MLAGGGAQREQAFLGLFEPARVGAALMQQVLQRRLGFGQRILRGGQGGDGRLGFLVGRGQAFQGAGGLAQRTGRRGGAAVARGEFGDGGGDGLGAPLALLEALTLGGEAVFLAFLRVQFAQFGDGVAQPFLLALRGGDHLARIGQALGRGAPGAPGFRGGGAAGFQRTEGIEQRAVAGRVRQAHLVVLALHLDQRRTQAAQQRDANGLVVDEGAGAAVRLHHAAQHQVFLGLDALLAQDVEGRVAGWRMEGGDDRGLRLSGAHHARFRTAAQCQAQAVEQDRFARPGLAGQRGQAGAEGEIEPFDQHHVADGEAGEHGRSVPLLRTASSRCGARSPGGRPALVPRLRPAARRNPGTRGCRGS